MDQIRWFHQIQLPEGITPGVDRSREKLSRLKIPQNLSGKTFLDIGAWDGFFSFEAEQRGAVKVLATDSFVWQGNVAGFSKAGFNYAHQARNSRVESLTIDAFDISPSTVGQWDVVLLAGVVYHTKNPWLLLERAASVTKQLLIVETVFSLRLWPKPAISIYANGFGGDSTNFCAPNIPALKAMLADCGFARSQVVSKSSMRHPRCVIHAFK